MVTPYLAQQTVTDFSSRFADLKYSCTLAITTDTTLTIPGKAHRYKALIKCMPTGQVWVSNNATAAAPAGNTFAASTFRTFNTRLSFMPRSDSRRCSSFFQQYSYNECKRKSFFSRYK